MAAPELLPEILNAIRAIVKDEVKGISDGMLAVTTSLASLLKMSATMQTDITTCKKTCGELETAANAAEVRITKLELENEWLKDQVTKLNASVASVTDHSRKFNIKIMGLPKGVEGPKPTAFVNKLLYETFGVEELGPPPLVNIAHRIGPQSQANRTMIVRLNSLDVRNTIVKMAAAKGKRGLLLFHDQRISIYPDLTTEQRERIAAFDEVRGLLRTANLRHGIIRPKMELLVTFMEETHTFKDPVKAKAFFEREIKPTLDQPTLDQPTLNA